MEECVEHIRFSISLLPNRVREKGGDRLALGLDPKWFASSVVSYRFEILKYQTCNLLPSRTNSGLER
jgi:hypothetical protein